MGGSKGQTDSSQSGNRSTVPEPTAEETELNRLRLEREKALDPSILQTQQQGFDLISSLLSGGEAGELPGFLRDLPGGISEDVTSDIVQKSLADIRPGLQSAGLFDSGVRSSLEARTAADIRTQTKQFNLGNLQQLLNLAVGGQAQVQQPVLGFGSQLSQSLAGLRSQQTTFNQSGSQTSSPFQQSWGRRLGEVLLPKAGA